METIEKTAVVSEIHSFDNIVEEACNKLMEKQIIHSIRRIEEMDKRLSDMERELDEFLCNKNGK